MKSESVVYGCGSRGPLLPTMTSEYQELTERCRRCACVCAACTDAYCGVAICVYRWRSGGGKTPTRSDFELQWYTPESVTRRLSGMDVEDVERVLSIRDNGWLSGQSIRHYPARSQFG